MFPRRVSTVGKRMLCVLLALVLSLGMLPVTAAAEGDVEINEANFPDPAFRKYVSENFDRDHNGRLEIQL